MKNEFDPGNGMNEQDFETVKRLIEDGNLSLSIELWQEEPRIRLHATVESYVAPIARVSLQALISHHIFVAADIGQSGGEDVEQMRSQLFTLAGRLRELAQIAEEQCRHLNPNIADWRSVPQLEPFDDSGENPFSRRRRNG